MAMQKGEYGVSIVIDDKQAQQDLKKFNKSFKDHADKNKKALKDVNKDMSSGNAKTLKGQKEFHKKLTKSLKGEYKEQLKASKVNGESRLKIRKQYLKKMERAERDHAKKVSGMKVKQAKRSGAAGAVAGGGMGKLALKAGAIGIVAGLGKAFLDAGAAAAEMVNSTAKIQTLLSDTQAQALPGAIDDLRQIAIETGAPLSELQNSLYNVISAVPSLANNLEAASAISEKAAKTGIALGASTEAVTSAATNLGNALGMNLEIGEDQNKIFDILANTMKQGVVPSGEALAASIAKSAPTMKALSANSEIAINALGSFNAILTANGISIEESQAQIKALGNELLDTEKKQKLMNAGIKGFDPETGKIKDWSEVMRTMGENTDEVMSIMTSSEAQNAVRILADNGGKAFAEMNKSMAESAGTADTMFSIMESSSEVKSKKMAASWKELQLKVGETVNNIVDGAKEFATKAMGFISDLFMSSGELAARAYDESMKRMEKMDAVGQHLAETSASLTEQLAAGGEMTTEQLEAGLLKVKNSLGAVNEVSPITAKYIQQILDDPSQQTVEGLAKMNQLLADTAEMAKFEEQKAAMAALEDHTSRLGISLREIVETGEGISTFMVSPEQLESAKSAMDGMVEGSAEYLKQQEEVMALQMTLSEQDQKKEMMMQGFGLHIKEQLDNMEIAKGRKLTEIEMQHEIKKLQQDINAEFSDIGETEDAITRGLFDQAEINKLINEEVSERSQLQEDLRNALTAEEKAEHELLITAIAKKDVEAQILGAKIQTGKATQKEVATHKATMTEKVKMQLQLQSALGGEHGYLKANLAVEAEIKSLKEEQVAIEKEKVELTAQDIELGQTTLGIVDAQTAAAKALGVEMTNRNDEELSALDFLIEKNNQIISEIEGQIAATDATIAGKMTLLGLNEQLKLSEQNIAAIQAGKPEDITEIQAVDMTTLEGKKAALSQRKVEMVKLNEALLAKKQEIEKDILSKRKKAQDKEIKKAEKSEKKILKDKELGAKSRLQTESTLYKNIDSSRKSATEDRIDLESKADDERLKKEEESIQKWESGRQSYMDSMETASTTIESARQDAIAEFEGKGAEIINALAGGITQQSFAKMLGSNISKYDPTQKVQKAEIQVAIRTMGFEIIKSLEAAKFDESYDKLVSVFEKLGIEVATMPDKMGQNIVDWFEKEAKTREKILRGGLAPGAAIQDKGGAALRGVDIPGFGGNIQVVQAELEETNRELNEQLKFGLAIIDETNIGFAEQSDLVKEITEEEQAGAKWKARAVELERTKNALIAEGSGLLDKSQQTELAALAERELVLKRMIAAGKENVKVFNISGKMQITATAALIENGYRINEITEEENNIRGELAKRFDNAIEQAKSMAVLADKGLDKENAKTGAIKEQNEELKKQLDALRALEQELITYNESQKNQLDLLKKTHEENLKIIETSTDPTKRAQMKAVEEDRYKTERKEVVKENVAEAMGKAVDIMQVIDDALNIISDDTMNKFDKLEASGQVVADALGQVTQLPIGEVFGAALSLVKSMAVVFGDIKLKRDESYQTYLKETDEMENQLELYAKRLNKLQEELAIRQQILAIYQAELDMANERAAADKKTMEQHMMEVGRLQAAMSGTMKNTVGWIDWDDPEGMARNLSRIDDEIAKKQALIAKKKDELEEDGLRRSDERKKQGEIDRLGIEIGILEGIDAEISSYLELYAVQDDHRRQVVRDQMSEIEHRKRMGKFDDNDEAYLKEKLAALDELYAIAEEQYNFGEDGLITQQELWAIEEERYALEQEILGLKEEQNEEDDEALDKQREALRLLHQERQALILKTRTGAELSEEEKAKIDQIQSDIISKMIEAGADPKAIEAVKESFAAASYKEGTASVPGDDLYYLHQGERVLDQMSNQRLVSTVASIENKQNTMMSQVTSMWLNFFEQMRSQRNGGGSLDQSQNVINLHISGYSDNQETADVMMDKLEEYHTEMHRRNGTIEGR